MPEGFDPYHKWLGIPPDEQPPNLYRLLGIRPFESDSDVISNAADGRMRTLKDFQTGPYSALSQKLLNEVATARVCLLNAEKKQVYDEQLREAVRVVQIDRGGPVLQRFEPLQPPPIQIDHAAATRRVVSNGQKGARNNVNTLLIAGAVAAGAATIGGIYMATSSGDREENGKKVHRMTEKDLASTTHGQPKLPEVPAFDHTAHTDVPPEEPARTQEKQPEIEVNPPEPQQPEQVASVNRSIQDIEKKPPETDDRNPFEPEPKMSDEARRALVAQILASAEQEGQKYEGSKDGCAKLLQHAKTEPDLTKRTALALAAAYAAAQQRSLPALNEAIAYAQQKSIGFMTHDEILQYQLSLLSSIETRSLSNEDRASTVMKLLGSLQAAYREENFELAEALLRQAHLYAYGENGRSRVWQGKEYKAKGAPVIEAVDEALEQLKDSTTLYREMKAGLGTDGQPQDSAAHFTMGVYLAKVQGDWNGALGHFSQGNNPHVAKAAEMDRGNPTDVASMFAVGKAWMKAGEVVQEGEICFQRAWMWYNKAKNMNPGGKVGLDIEGELRGLRGRGVGVEKVKEVARQPKEKEKPGEAEFPKGKWVESKLDHSKAIQGKMKIGDNKIITLDSRTRIALPLQFSDNASYDLSFTFIRTLGDDTVSAMIPVGKNRISLLLSTGRGSYSGFCKINGLNADKNGTKFSGVFQNNRPYTVVISVRVKGNEASIATFFPETNQQLNYWIGDWHSCSEEGDHSLPVPGAVGLGTNQINTEFSNIKIRLLAGDAQSN